MPLIILYKLSNVITNNVIFIQRLANNREGRAGIDLVHDKPETELLKEGEVLRGVQNLFRRDIEQATEQIRFAIVCVIILLSVYKIFSDSSYLRF